MPPRQWKFRIGHILDAIERIDRYTAGMTFPDFQSNEMVLDAVIRNFIVIGEAARHIPPEVVARYPQLPIADMRAMRNVVVHDYDNVRTVTLWRTIRDDLPTLLPILHDIIDREPEFNTDG